MRGSAGAGVPRPERMASLALAGLAGLHLLWATGSPWPLPDRAAFADAVMGHDRFPPSAASAAVAMALASGSAFVGGRPKRAPGIRRVGAVGVVCALSLRGALGIAGRTDLVSPGSTSERFRALDRKLYAPTCLAIAALFVPATRGVGA